MGETLRLRPGETVRFALTLKGVQAGTAQLVIDGAMLGSGRARCIGSRFPGVLAQRRARHWIRAEVRDAQGHLILIGNPIYIAPAR